MSACQQYVPSNGVDCPNACGLRVSPGSLKNHMRYRCVMRKAPPPTTHPCGYCSSPKVQHFIRLYHEHRFQREIGEALGFTATWAKLMLTEVLQRGCTKARTCPLCADPPVFRGLFCTRHAGTQKARRWSQTQDAKPLIGDGTPAKEEDLEDHADAPTLRERYDDLPEGLKAKERLLREKYERTGAAIEASRARSRELWDAWLQP
jgi:hypothetical protein